MLKLVAVTKPLEIDDFRFDPDTFTLEFGDTEEDWDAAWEMFIEWSNWMRQGVDNVLDFANPITQEGWSARPSHIDTLSMVYREPR